MKLFFRAASLGLGVLLLVSCGKKGASPPPPPPVADLAGKFVFEPTLGTTYHHTMTRAEAFEIVGTPVKQLEEWEARWAMSITPSGEDYLYRAELESLKIAVNETDVLLGPEVTGRGGRLELLFDRSARILDVRQTETLTQVLLEVSTPEVRPRIAAMFSPEALRMLFAERASERSRDLVGHSAAIGAKWPGEVPGPSGGPVAKQLEVMSNEDCAANRCVRVERRLFVDRALIWAGAQARVKDFVLSRGEDPEKVELLEADVKGVDGFVVDPRTMEFHGARFEQSAELKVRGPRGEFLVRSSTVRQSSYEY